MRRSGTRASGGKRAVFFLAAALIFSAYACAGNIGSSVTGVTETVRSVPESSARTGSTPETGADTESGEEASLIASDRELKSDVLKVAHHGSSSSSAYSFLTAVRPEYAVISSGTGNSYHDPGEHTLEQLKRVGAEIFRTDRDGDIVCSSDGTGIRFEQKLR